MDPNVPEIISRISGRITAFEWRRKRSIRSNKFDSNLNYDYQIPNKLQNSKFKITIAGLVHL